MRRPSVPLTGCSYCGGTGSVPGTTAGEILRREREEREVPRISKGENPELGLAHHFGYSEAYTLDLERGVRPWTWRLVERYRQAIEDAVKARLEHEEKENVAQ